MTDDELEERYKLEHGIITPYENEATAQCILRQRRERNHWKQINIVRFDSHNDLTFYHCETCNRYFIYSLHESCASGEGIETWYNELTHEEAKLFLDVLNKIDEMAVWRFAYEFRAHNPSIQVYGENVYKVAKK